MKKRHRHPLDPVIYMYLNTVTEMVYVGSSKYGLEHRHKRHLKDMKRRHLSRFYTALTLWSECFWERVILERCTEQELDAAERKWIAETNALDPGVGYNSYDGHRHAGEAGGRSMQKREFTDHDRAVLAVNGSRAHDSSATMETVIARRSARVHKKSRFASMSAEEQREFFRLCGQKGAEASVVVRNGPSKKQLKAAKRAALEAMTPAQRAEFFRECGRRGAAKSRGQLELSNQLSLYP